MDAEKMDGIVYIVILNGCFTNDEAFALCFGVHCCLNFDDVDFLPFPMWGFTFRLVDDDEKLHINAAKWVVGRQ